MLGGFRKCSFLPGLYPEMLSPVILSIEMGEGSVKITKIEQFEIFGLSIMCGFSMWRRFGCKCCLEYGPMWLMQYEYDRDNYCHFPDPHSALQWG